MHETSIEFQPCISAQYVQKAKLYIDNNFNNNITVSDVAGEVFINERYLYNLFIKYGYEDLLAFSKFFTKRAGICPSRYKEKSMKR